MDAEQLGFTHVPESAPSALISRQMALDAAREAMIAAAAPDTYSFPVVLAHAQRTEARFTIKSAATKGAVGLKVGSYWPGNEAIGLPRHSSAIVLIDEATGRVAALVEAAMANAYRTAAADAVAALALGPPDARRLTIFGAGHQAGFEALALWEALPLDHVSLVARDAAQADALAARLRSQGVDAAAAEPEAAVRAADVIVTATGARAPLFPAHWVRPGAHVASMGSDAVGKQELDPALFENARLFCDLRPQSRAIGEFQHCNPTKWRGVVQIGDVLSGAHPGRTSDWDVTVFDSSGLALQDLVLARRLLQAFREREAGAPVRSQTPEGPSAPM